MSLRFLAGPTPSRKRLILIAAALALALLIGVALWLAGNKGPAAPPPPNYGKLVLFDFPKGKLVFGPRQVEARIDQDAFISQQISLWSQAGSQVIRGSLLAIPIEESLLYVQPLYLAAERGIPFRVVAASDQLRHLVAMTGTSELLPEI